MAESVKVVRIKMKKNNMKNTPYIMSYNELRYHVGHKIELNDVWDWGTNRETSIEIRCSQCEGVEPLLEVDVPK